MNATYLLPSINAQDYQETMQKVARDYLVRHWMEHLDDGQLIGVSGHEHAHAGRHGCRL
jgi:hypothetical protein